VLFVVAEIKTSLYQGRQRQGDKVTESADLFEHRVRLGLCIGDGGVPVLQAYNTSLSPRITLLAYFETDTKSCKNASRHNSKPCA